MAPHLIIALIGLLYVLFFGLLSYFRREGVSTRFIAESLILTALATIIVWAAGWDVNPVLFILLVYLVTMRVRILVDVGNWLARRKDYGRAERVYGLAERAWPDETGRLLIKMNRGVMAVFRGDMATAIATLRGVLAAAEGGFLSSKATAASHYNLGVAHLRLGQDAQATLEFNAVLEDWPMTEYARYARIALDRRKAAASPTPPSDGGPTGTTPDTRS